MIGKLPYIMQRFLRGVPGRFGEAAARTGSVLRLSGVNLDVVGIILLIVGIVGSAVPRFLVELGGFGGATRTNHATVIDDRRV